MCAGAFAHTRIIINISKIIIVVIISITIAIILKHASHLSNQQHAYTRTHEHTRIHPYTLNCYMIITGLAMWMSMTATWTVQFSM